MVLAIKAGERQCSVAARPECDEATVWRACQRYRHGGLACLLADARQDNLGHPQQISRATGTNVELLLEPLAKGLYITHWSSGIWPARRSMTRSSLRIVPRHGSAPHLHRCRFQGRIGLGIGRRLGWTPASRSERSKSFGAMPMRLGLPNRHLGGVRPRDPDFPGLGTRPRSASCDSRVDEQQEFDYTRNGTVNMLVFLVVPSGVMELAFLAKNDADHYLPELMLFHRQHKELQGVFLIQYGGSGLT